MRASKALERLLRIRGLEEEQKRAFLGSALSKLEALKRAHETTIQSEQQGHARLRSSAASGEIVDRQAALVELEVARARSRALASRIVASEVETARRRQEVLDKRVERRQADTLFEEAVAREAVKSDRRSQVAIDDRCAARGRRHPPDRSSPKSPSAASDKSGARR